MTEPRDKLENFAETYVILITERDVMGDGLPIYHINRVVEETGKKFQDKAHITYEVLAERVRYFKEDEEGVAAMCKAMEDMRNEATLEKAKKTALNMLMLGKLSYEEIAQCAELPVDEVKALAEKKGA